MTSKDLNDRERIIGQLDELGQKAANGLMRPHELRDFDLMARINAASEGDNLESRIKVAKVDARASELEDDYRRAEFNKGQNEDEYREEVLDAQSRYIKYKNSAWRQALDELRAGKI